VVTIFTIPKPFQGHIGIIQENAIESWRRICPTCEILLFGDEEGIERVAHKFNALHIPDIRKNEFGTPLLDDVFLKAKNLTRHRLLCYANADIILFKDFVQVVNRVHFKNFLMTGRRWNLGIKERLDFAFDDWQQRLVRRVNEYGTLDSVWAMDYFVFPNNSELTTIPPFAVGRPGWDNWFVFRARELRVPVIDATKAILILHQSHDYNHVPFRIGDTWEGPEADRNWKLVGDFNKDFNLMDATHVMTERAVVSALTLPYLKRRWQKMTVLFPHLTPLVKPLSRALNLGKRIPGALSIERKRAERKNPTDN
jgi:hypothetical protein